MQTLQGPPFFRSASADGEALHKAGEMTRKGPEGNGFSPFDGSPSGYGRKVYGTFDGLPTAHYFL